MQFKAGSGSPGGHAGGLVRGLIYYLSSGGVKECRCRGALVVHLRILSVS
jgi:hypothetical protein